VEALVCGAWTSGDAGAPVPLGELVAEKPEPAVAKAFAGPPGCPGVAAPPGDPAAPGWPPAWASPILAPCPSPGWAPLAPAAPAAPPLTPCGPPAAALVDAN